MDNKKTILITGSSRGIGEAVARLAKEQGYAVILHGKTESDNLKNLANELNSKYLVCDVSDEKAVFEAVNKYDKIDILVNNAGINKHSAPFLDTPLEGWKETYEVNVFGTVNFSKAIIPKMKENNYGRIVNISSIKGFENTVGSIAYASSKAAIRSITAGMAKELAKDNISVNAVAPGFTNTSMTAQTMSDRLKKQIDTILLKRMAKPKEIAEAIMFLASDKASYITGQTIIVDGGFYIKNE